MLLAEVRFSENEPPLRTVGHVRQKSDELIEDLELQLGHSRVSYMQIRISYAHSAFPDDYRSEAVVGVSSIQSRTETLATATLKRHSTVSPWSPRPTPAPNPLFQLIEKHWGMEKAREAMQQILAQRSTPRKAAQAGLAACKEDSMQSLHASANTSQTSSSRIDRPLVPMRQASLQRAAEPKLRTPVRADSQGSLGGFDTASSSQCRAQWSDQTPSTRSRTSGREVRTLTSE